MRKIFFIAALTSLTVFSQAQILLDEVMTKDEQKKTGVNTLSKNQKIALEAWLNRNFVLKQQPLAPSSQLYLSININNGQMLQMTDNSVWEINPGDINTSSVWITPFPVKIEPSSNPQYPYRITNLNSSASVLARPYTGSPTPTPPSTQGIYQ